ncbi:AraC family transcriptional regulator [Chitinophaga varians]|uniref:AraC family transcriptional regulator n=1 Tax=Chitinophaga varians TaxID=2202339 RepID=A0A847RZX6_9BACT|nr:AraC family transcriptional regulator [Chitinophaga varians]NLR67604.1 AraC family transcriptional regulator [Chitinophaga varians]
MNTGDTSNLVRVYDTLNFVEENYSRLISVKELEQVSHYSYRNIQRIFKYTCGETIGAYQQRLKVENAYKMILYTRETLSSIALEVGFANVASFSKAFRLHFGMSPSEARERKLPLLAGAEIVPQETATRLMPEIIYVPPVTVYYQSAFIDYNHEEVEALWERFMLHQFDGAGTVFYGIVADEPLIRESLKCRYDACASTQGIKGKLPSKTIPAGRYASFMHYGSYENIEDTYQKIYAGWILDTHLEFAPTPVIEKYIKHPDNTASIAEQETAIWLPLQ